MWGSKLLGNYAKNAMNAGNMGRAAAATGLRDFLTGMKGYSGATRRTVYGAAAGAGYGMFSDDTSVLGGAAMGGLAGRYLGAGFNRARGAGVGMGLGAHAKAYGAAFGRGVRGMARVDYRGARIATNKGVNRIGSSLKGWGRGLGGGI